MQNFRKKFITKTPVRDNEVCNLRYFKYLLKTIHPQPEGIDYFCLTAVMDNTTMAILCQYVGVEPMLPNLEYSIDKVNWERFIFEPYTDEEGRYISQILTLEAGEKMYLRGTNPFGLSIVSDGSIEQAVSMSLFMISNSDFTDIYPITASGDIGTLIDGIGGPNVLLPIFSYSNLTTPFFVCDFKNAPKLLATTLSPGCYCGMFRLSNSMTKAPDLPGTILKDFCYEGMFYGQTFPMSDDGVTFNFKFGAVLPQIVSKLNGDTITLNTHKDVAEWMGNTTGFN